LDPMVNITIDLPIVLNNKTQVLKMTTQMKYESLVYNGLGK